MERTADEYLLTKFRKKKVEISFAITDFYPFLYELKDYRIMSEEMFERCRAQEKPMAQVIYDVLESLEANLNEKVLKVLFSKSNLQNYPLLQKIHRSFTYVQEDSSSEEENDFPNTSHSENGTSSSESDSDNGSDFQSSGERSNAEGNLGGPKKTQGRRSYRGQSVDFESEELLVTCGEAKGILFKKKMQENVRNCIRNSDGEWLTPREFEVKGNRASSKNWKKSIFCYGRPLSFLLEKGFLPSSSSAVMSNRNSYRRNLRNSGFAGSQRQPQRAEEEEEEDARSESEEFNFGARRCSVCNKLCKSGAGLRSHIRVHKTWFP
ncbi:nuclear autoantigen Sp-100-like [Tachyglossus aculeatus]|uniref:nuclear autoantigen Sp-100-like n=1 Tax=Tachyglossus aculeatus TaxID=9261 RepID=UPI0018F5DBCB|nr:nuclear autoantigen Sp-100-like [Tachyglossus aculeatus]